MGARSRNSGGKKGKARRKSTHIKGPEPTTATFDLAGGANSDVLDGTTVISNDGRAPAGRIPPCAVKLFQSSQYAEIEECCGDIRYFALKPRTHQQLKSCGVPAKLAEILLLEDVVDNSRAAAVATSGGGEGTVHKGIVYAHIAAAEALRNLISNDISTNGSSNNANNSCHNNDNAATMSILTLLTTSDHDGAAVAAQTAFSARLVIAIQRVWTLCVSARRSVGSQEWMSAESTTTACDDHPMQQQQQQEGFSTSANGEEGDVTQSSREDGNSTSHAGHRAPTSSHAHRDSTYLVLLRLLEELLLLACLCADGSEKTAEICAGLPGFLPSTLLATLQSAMTTAFHNMRHSVSCGAGSTGADPTDSNRGRDHEDRIVATAMCFWREEAKGLAKVSVAAADLLRTLTAACEGLALALLGSPVAAAAPQQSPTTEQFTFLNETVDASALRPWLHAYVRDTAGQCLQPVPISFEENTIFFQLTQACLHVQGALMNASAASVAVNNAALPSSVHGSSMHKRNIAVASPVVTAAAASTRRLLPLIIHVFSGLPPMQLWSAALPLLLQDACDMAVAFAAFASGVHNRGSPLYAFLYRCYQAEMASSSNNGGSERSYLLSEDTRAAAVEMCVSQMRCVQVAAKVFLEVVTFICEQNGSGDDDEATFRSNPLSKLLFEAIAAADGRNAMMGFGAVLKNILWMDRGVELTNTNLHAAASIGNAADVMNSVGGGDSSLPHQQLAPLLIRERRLLTRFTEENAEATTMQFILLSTEVAIWQTASTLMMMLPVDSLGMPALLWSALVQHVDDRHRLTVAAETQNAAALDGGNSAEDPFLIGDNLNNSTDESVTAARHAMVVGPTVQQLLWMQLEPLTTILWTIQRKNGKLFLAENAKSGTGGGGNHHSLSEGAIIHAQPTDCDLLIRICWESRAEASVKQACVATVGLICAAMGTAEAATVGARFCLAVLARGRSPQLAHLETELFRNTSKEAEVIDANKGNSSIAAAVNVLELGHGVVAKSSAPPTQPQERRRWWELLSAVDAVVSLRCEAANATMDLFLDERFDASVYVPLAVQQTLTAFHASLRLYLKKRVQLAKETRKHYKVAAADCDEEEVAQWAEVEENLKGFLAYKAANVRA